MDEKRMVAELRRLQREMKRSLAESQRAYDYRRADENWREAGYHAGQMTAYRRDLRSIERLMAEFKIPFGEPAE